MSNTNISRRLAIIAGLGIGAGSAFGVFSYLASSTHPTADSNSLTLKWEDLVPLEDREVVQKSLAELSAWNDGDSWEDESFDDLTQLEDFQTMPFERPEYDVGMVTAYNDQEVRIPGYIVPIAYIGEAVSEFLLVPFIGACIHVPPPPPNQIVLVQPRKPFIIEDTWEPVYAKGAFKTSEVSTELAQVGYIMWQADIEPFA